MRNFLIVFLFVPLSVFAEGQCPPNSSPDILRDVCRCNTGYEVKNNQCVGINIPDNASASIMGGWQCNTGYRKDGDKCNKVQLPDNAHFTFGSVWECNAGFTQNGNSCRAMNRNELVEQVKLLNQMLIIQMSKSSGGRCSSGFDACEDECDDQFSSYYDKKKCVEACEEGEDACD